ncbi:MAG: hypothetical protein EAX89_11025 [Candidatus Lokiarchaeota archaeon]|nr:hypothetical protein [Candidatus Lokiarchaeota archaeon]
MLKRSFNKFLEKPPDNSELYPYLYSIGFKGLTTSKQQIKIKPIKCSQCGAILTNIDEIKEDSKIGTYFKCEFCGTINSVSKEQILEHLSDDVDFILEDIQLKKPKDEKKITSVGYSEGELYISVIDISGSMSGAKIEAVKKSLIQTIKDFKINAPTTKFFLIAFESSVYYYLKHDKAPLNFTGELLLSLDEMKLSLEKSITGEQKIGSIGEFADSWIKKVSDLRSMDMTALGPALYFAIISFELFKFSTGRITLLTDGMANQGVGNLSGTSIGAEKFYNHMADLCNKNNIVVDIVGVSNPGDSNEMGLQILGNITDKTGGKMFLISDQEMGAVFKELQEIRHIGRDVTIKLITPLGINIKNVTGAYSSTDIKESEINLGAVTEDRELYIELDAKKGLEKEIGEVPVQLQVNYKDKDGRRRLRVINDRVKTTKNENEFKSNYDQKLNAMYNIQFAGVAQYAGKGAESKKRLQNLKENLEKEYSSLKAQGKAFYAESDFNEGLEFLDEELEELKMEDERAMNAPQASFMATQGQSRYRMSINELKKKIEKKKEK